MGLTICQGRVCHMWVYEYLLNNCLTALYCLVHDMAVINKYITKSAAVYYTYYT